jgi:hypothetical protein
MKHRAPEFELAQAETVFNLAAETTGDGDREAEERRDRAEAARAAAHRQPDLFLPTKPDVN